MTGEHERADDPFIAEEARWADRYGLLFLLILLSLVLTAANTTWLKIAAVLVQGGVVLFARPDSHVADFHYRDAYGWHAEDMTLLANETP